MPRRLRVPVVVGTVFVRAAAVRGFWSAVATVAAGRPRFFGAGSTSVSGSATNVDSGVSAAAVSAGFAVRLRLAAVPPAAALS